LGREGSSVAEASRLAQAIFDEAAKRDLHLALAQLPVGLFPEGAWPDAALHSTVTCLRSVLMKPEHLDWVDRIWEILAAASEVQASSRVTKHLRDDRGDAKIGNRDSENRARGQKAGGMDFERLALVSDDLRVEVIPELGAKISSLWLPRSSRKSCCKRRSGLTQAATAQWPSMREMRVASMSAFRPSRGARLDRPCCPIMETSGGSRFAIAATATSWFWMRRVSALPLHFEKRLSLHGNRLTMAYTLRNTGETSVQYLWSAHPGLRG
jgi:hypothetical protein